MNKIISIIALILVCILFIDMPLDAQCPMCRMSAESNLANGGTVGKGLNTGILYMFVMPYLMVMTLGYIWYRNRKRVV